MANFLKKKAKLIFFIYTIILSSVFILGCCFMTNYKDIMVNFSLDANNKVIILDSTEGVVGTGKNANLFNKFSQGMFTKDYCDNEIIRLESGLSTLDANIIASEASIVKSEEKIASLNEELISLEESIPQLEADLAVAEAILDANVSEEVQAEVDRLEEIRYEKLEYRNSIDKSIEDTEAELENTRTEANKTGSEELIAKVAELEAKLVQLEADYQVARQEYLDANNAYKDEYEKIEVYKEPYDDAYNALLVASNRLNNVIPSEILTEENNIVIQNTNIETYEAKIVFKQNEITRVKNELAPKYAAGDFVNLGSDFNAHSMTVYEFRTQLNEFNQLIFTFGMFSIVALVFLYIFANHSRRIYYKSNLFAGIILPLVPVVFAVIMIIKDLNLMSTFNDNYDLFNFVSVLQNNVTSNEAYDWSMPTIMDAYSCTSLTFILTMVVYIIIIVFSLFMMIYTLYRYKSCAKERAEIIDRAVANND